MTPGTSGPLNEMGFGFVDPAFLAPETDEFTLREEQQLRSRSYRALDKREIAALAANGNTADDWSHIQVTEGFQAHLVQGCRFFGRIRIGPMQHSYLTHAGRRDPIGLYDCTIISCDIGANPALHRVGYLAHTILGDNVRITQTDEIYTTDEANFGTSVVKMGQDETQRLWIEVINENGGRRVAPFVGMTIADTALGALFRDNSDFLARLLTFTDVQAEKRRGVYSVIGDNVVISNCRTLKNIQLGPACLVENALRLENVTLQSETDAPIRIGDGVILRDAIASYGCKVLSAAQGEHVLLGENVTLSKAARVSHSIVGDNSTIIPILIEKSCFFTCKRLMSDNHGYEGLYVVQKANHRTGTPPSDPA